MDRAVNKSDTDQSNNRLEGSIRNVASTGYVHVGGVHLLCCITNSACNC